MSSRVGFEKECMHCRAHRVFSLSGKKYYQPENLHRLFKEKPLAYCLSVGKSLFDIWHSTTSLFEIGNVFKSNSGYLGVVLEQSEN